MMKIAVAAMISMLSVSLYAAEAEPIFSTDFDDAGVTVATTEGVRGKALLAGSEKSPFLKYTLPEAINPKAGTVCFWFKPENWDASYPNNLDLFVASTGRSRVRIYKNAVDPKSSFNSKIVFLFGKTKNSAGAAAFQRVAAPLNWKSGAWYFIAATWNEGRISIYSNGRLCAVNVIVEPVGPISEVILGSSGGSVPAQTALDEVEIFDRELSAAEIKARFDKSRRK